MVQIRGGDEDASLSRSTRAPRRPYLGGADGRCDGVGGVRVHDRDERYCQKHANSRRQAGQQDHNDSSPKGDGPGTHKPWFAVAESNRVHGLVSESEPQPLAAVRVGHHTPIGTPGRELDGHVPPAELAQVAGDVRPRLDLRRRVVRFSVGSWPQVLQIPGSLLRTHLPPTRRTGHIDERCDEAETPRNASHQSMRQEVPQPPQVVPQTKGEPENNGVQVLDARPLWFGHGEDYEEQALVLIGRDIYEY